MKRQFYTTLILVAIFSASTLSAAPDAFASSTHIQTRTQAQINDIVMAELAKYGSPSASIAVINGGKLVYTHAYGHASLKPARLATTSMQYSIGSISKQFAAAAILLLQQDGRIKLSDSVSKFLPELTDASHVTIRELLSHTSGYQDYWPQDYAPPAMHHATTPQSIINHWAKRPLDFKPGTKWQYSNTNYTIIGEIIKHITGETPFIFLSKHVFAPLGMRNVYDTNLHPLPGTDLKGYHRYALGPLRVTQSTGANWLFGAGELAMTPGTLVKWDIAMMQRKLLSSASWHAMETDVLLRNGLPAGYGLGQFIGRFRGQRWVHHGGEVVGFTAANFVLPDDGIAVIVMVNQDAVATSSVIARQVATLMLGSRATVVPKASLMQARNIFRNLQQGKIDRSVFSTDANSYFTQTALRDYRMSLAPLGIPESFTATGQRHRGGMTQRTYELSFKNQKLRVNTYTLPNGKLEQYIVSPAS